MFLFFILFGPTPESFISLCFKFFVFEFKAFNFNTSLVFGRWILDTYWMNGLYPESIFNEVLSNNVCLFSECQEDWSIYHMT